MIYCMYTSRTSLAHILDHGTSLHFHRDDPLPVIACVISLSTLSDRLPKPTIELRSDVHRTLRVGFVG